MGLDMYVYATATRTPAVDFPEPADAELLHSWRKHHRLHHWMSLLYRTLGGAKKAFNLTAVVIDDDTLDYLADDILHDRLPDKPICFLGHGDADRKDDDLAFVAKARAALERGLTVYYIPSW